MSASGSHGSRKALWVATFAPLVAWASEGTSSLLVTIEACHRGHAALARTVVVLIGAISLAVAVASAAYARRRLRLLGVMSHPFHVEGRQNDESIALWALTSATLFGLATIWSAFPAILMHGVCEAGR